MIKRNLIANYLGQGWSAVMGIAFVPLYIKYLGVEAYGLIGLFSVLQAWLGLLDMGMTPTLSRQMARFTGGGVDAQSIRNLLRTVEMIAVLIAAIMSGSLWAASDWIATYWLQTSKLPIETVASAFTIMGAVTALRFLEGIYRSSIIGLQKQVSFNVISSAMATLRGLGAVAVLAWIKPDIGTFFFWQGAVSILTLLILAWVTYQALPMSARSGRFSFAELHGVMRFAGGMMGISLLSLLLMQADKILLSKLLTLSEYGYYMLASTVAGALYMMVYPIGQTWFPRLSELHAQGDVASLTNAYHLSAQLVSVTMGSAAIVLIVFSEKILYVWTNDVGLVYSTATLVSLLAFGNLLNGLMWIPYQTQLAFGWTGLTVRINIVAVFIIVPVVIWVAPHYGAVGAAWAWSCLNAGYVLVGVHFMYRKILREEKLEWYRDDLIKPLGGATLAAGAISYLLTGKEVGMGAQLVLLCVTCVVVILSAAVSAPRVRQKILNGGWGGL